MSVPHFLLPKYTLSKGSQWLLCAKVLQHPPTPPQASPLNNLLMNRAPGTLCLPVFPPGSQTLLPCLSPPNLYCWEVSRICLCYDSCFPLPFLLPFFSVRLTEYQSCYYQMHESFIHLIGTLGKVLNKEPAPSLRSTCSV